MNFWAGFEKRAVTGQYVAKKVQDAARRRLNFMSLPAALVGTHSQTKNIHKFREAVTDIFHNPTHPVKDMLVGHRTAYKDYIKNTNRDLPKIPQGRGAKDVLKRVKYMINPWWGQK